MKCHMFSYQMFNNDGCKYECFQSISLESSCQATSSEGPCFQSKPLESRNPCCDSTCSVHSHFIVEPHLLPIWKCLEREVYIASTMAASNFCSFTPIALETISEGLNFPGGGGGGGGGRKHIIRTYIVGVLYSI